MDAGAAQVIERMAGKDLARSETARGLCWATAARSVTNSKARSAGFRPRGRGRHRRADILADFLKELWPLREPAAQSLHKVVVALAGLGSCRRLEGFWQLWRRVQPKPNKQRNHLDGYTDVPLEPLDPAINTIQPFRDTARRPSSLRSSNALGRLRLLENQRLSGAALDLDDGGVGAAGAPAGRRSVPPLRRLVRLAARIRHAQTDQGFFCC